MKYKSGLVLFYLTLSNSLLANNPLKSSLFIKSGISLAQQSYVNSFYTFNKTHQAKHNLPSFYIGAQYQPRFKLWKFNLHTDVSLFEKGFKSNFTNSASNNTRYTQNYSYNLNYLDIQINLGLKAKRFMFSSGVNISYLLSAKQFFYEKDFKVSSNRMFESNFVQDYTDRFLRWDWGINYSCSYALNNTFHLEANVYKSFNRIDKLKQFEVIYNQFFTLGLKYNLL
ncbi:MAG: outer membrane beta-barrel protein [Bacteroidia bacterium]|nr:outer membrane beta-barrel protein [Bacteroidia bacterium]MBP9688403.1 outer membrane beta-barrel protein [Bacteroidia bacterium]